MMRASRWVWFACLDHDLHIHNTTHGMFSQRIASSQLILHFIVLTPMLLPRQQLSPCALAG